MTRCRRGLTAIELMIVLVVLGVLASLAFPNMRNFMDRQRLVSQMRTVADLAQLARSEAIKRSAAGPSEAKTIAMTINPGTSWSIGLANGTAACADAGTCQINEGGAMVTHLISASECAACTLEVPTSQQVILFDLRGLVSGGADRTITLKSPMGKQLTLQINRLGRMSLCSPGATVVGYVACT
jgi:prepilin-type N-terminal cleavage/methylation domain-containing protein